MGKSVSDCGRLMKEITDCMEKEANNALRPYGLTLTQVSALSILQEYPEGAMPLKKLEQELHVSQPTVTGIVSRLQQKGLITLLDDAADRRAKSVSLTEEGRSKCPEARGQKELAEKRMLEALSKSDQEKFRKMLRKIRKNLMK